MKISIANIFKLKNERNIMTRSVLCCGNKIIFGFLYDKKGFSDTKIFCFDKNTFTSVWEHAEEGNVVYGGAVTPEGNSIWVCYAQRVICLSGKTGEPIWQFTADSDNALSNNSNISANRIIVTEFHDDIHYLYCLDTGDGKCMWKALFEGHCKKVIISDDKKVFVVSESHIYCFDLQTGKILWSVTSSEYIRSGGISKDYIALGFQGKILFFDKKQGKQIAQYKTADVKSEIITVTKGRSQTSYDKAYLKDIEAVTAADNNTFYPYDLEGHLYALRLDIGKGIWGKHVSVTNIWTYQSEKGPLEDTCGVPDCCPIGLCTVLDNDRLLISEEKGQLSIVDALSGALITKLQPAMKETADKIAVSDNSLFLLCNKGYLYSIDCEL
jgi:outer membrane protein assembly factor BamB